MSRRLPLYKTSRVLYDRVTHEREVSAMDAHKLRRALRAAFPHTIPIMVSFLFLGMTYGLYARASGLGWQWATAMSALVFGGSLEFVAVSMLMAPFAPLQTFLLAFVIQARHLFYGLSLLDRYRGLGAKKPYMIWTLCDETFSINVSTDPPEGVDRGWFMFFISLLDQLYWITGATLGGLLGSMLPFDTAGLDFIMTAMFTVFLTEQLLKEKRHGPALIGAGAALGCRVLLGADSFMIPAMAAITALLVLFRGPIERGLEE